MTIRAAVGDIEDVFLGVFVFHLLPVMTVVAGITIRVGWMTAGAHAICIFMVYWESVSA